MNYVLASKIGDKVVFFCILPGTPVEKYVEVHFHVWLQHRQMLSVFCH